MRLLTLTIFVFGLVGLAQVNGRRRRNRGGNGNGGGNSEDDEPFEYDDEPLDDEPLECRETEDCNSMGVDLKVG